MEQSLVSDDDYMTHKRNFNLEKFFRQPSDDNAHGMLGHGSHGDEGEEGEDDKSQGGGASNSGVTDGAVSQEGDGDELSRLVNHIIDQVDKGHVTYESMMHWNRELTTALSRGLMTQDEYNSLLATIGDHLHRGSTQDEVVCCPFG